MTEHFHSSIAIAKLFTKHELESGQQIYFRHKGEASFQDMKAELRDKIVKPVLARINQVTGQENDPDFLAYAMIHIYQTVEK